MKTPLAAAAVAVIALAAASGSAPAAEQPLLSEVASFSGAILFLETKVPALVIGIRHGEESAVAGFGEIRAGSGRAPDGDTLMRIGSITKTFAGAALASLVADGTVRFTDPLATYLPGAAVPERDGRAITLIDLGTHSAGLPRELAREDGPPDDPFATVTVEAMVSELATDPLLFAPGTGALYSNYGFDFLAVALAAAAGESYADLLKARVLDPAGMASTTFAPDLAATDNLMQGHNFDGSPMPDVPTPVAIEGAGGLFSTANDILRYTAFLTDAAADGNAEMRLLATRPWVYRDALDLAVGFDEAGRMEALGLGWVVVKGEGGGPTILQKTGGLQGVFSYVAFSPANDVAVFVAVNAFEVSAVGAMAEVANGIVASLARGR